MNPSTPPSEGASTSKALLELTLIVLSGEKRKAKSEKRKAKSEKRKAESRKQKAESRKRIAFALIVPTLRVGMQPGTLRVPFSNV